MSEPKIYRRSPEMAQRTDKRAKLFTHICAMLDTPASIYDDMDLNEAMSKLRQAMATAGLRTDEQKAMALGETISLGGEDIRIDPLPARKAEVWRKEYIKLMHPCEDMFEALQGGQRSSEFYEWLGAVSHARLLALELYLEQLGGTVPDNATDHEVKRALDMAEMLSFPTDALVPMAAETETAGTSAEPKG